jgi:hypothetical protein
MATIFLFALAAAVYPQLLAVVVIVLTRPEPKPLLWACYLGSLVVAVGCGVAFVAIFRSRGSVAGTSSSALGPSAFIAVGVIAVALAIFVATRPGQEMVGRHLPRLRRRRRNDENASGAVKRVTSWAHRALKEGSFAVAAVAGVILAVPGVFDLLAFGRLARGGYGRIVLGAVIVGFVLIKFLLIEVPIVGYAISPTYTSVQVNRFSGWMQANKLQMLAAIVGVIGFGLIVEGILDLA